jgi:hypothetical protein
MRYTAIFLMILAVLGTSGCVPVVAGAAGAIAADTISEDRGRDLF